MSLFLIPEWFIKYPQDLSSIISISWREIWLYLNKKYHVYTMRKSWILFLSVLQNHSMLNVMMYHNLYCAKLNLGLLWRLSSKESACTVGDLSSIPGLGRSPGGGHGNSLQYSCLENSMDGGAWRVTVNRAGTELDITEVTRQQQTKLVVWF